jgi:hypothetical protein
MRAIVLLLVIAAPAAADTVGGLTYRFGDRAYRERNAEVDAFAVSLGRHFGRYAMYGELELGYQHDDDGLRGFGTGVTFHTQRRICHYNLGDSHDQIRIPCWIDLGLGYQSILTSNENVSRPVFSIGVGGGLEARSGKTYGGMTFGITFEFAPSRGLRDDTIAARMTTTSERHLDIGVMFNTNFAFSP